MRRADALTPDVIVDVALRVIERDGVERFTLRRLGDALEADPTAVYRHFRDKDALVRAVADRLFAQVADGFPRAEGDWRVEVREICTRLRHALMAHPGIAALVASAPPRGEHDLRFTEVLLAELVRSGIDDEQVALAYHALVGLTIGTAAIDAPLAMREATERAGLYRAWRRDYLALDDDVAPVTVRIAPHLWAGSADERFTFALDRVLDGLSSTHRASTPTSTAPAVAEPSAPPPTRRSAPADRPARHDGRSRPSRTGRQ